MSYIDKLHKINELQATIQAQGPLPTDVLKRINYKFRLEWNYTSNSMEGNSLTRQETRSIMVGNITVNGKPFKDIQEMQGHDGVITDILRMGKGELNISESRIRDIHRAIVHEDNPEKAKNIGRWKTEPNYLYNYKNERFDFAAPAEVPERMHELMNWLAAEREKIDRQAPGALHPVMLALQFHLDYITIHPFYDGNGRTARIFTNIILIAYGYPPLYIKGDEKDRYYQYLGDIQGYGGSPDLFYEFMADLLLRSMQLVMNAIKGEEIDEIGDLDKKLTLLKKRLSPHIIQESVKYSLEAITEVAEKTLKPLAKALEKRLQSFDELFEERKVTVSMSGELMSGHDLEKLAETIAERIPSRFLNNQPITDIVFHINYSVLLVIVKNDLTPQINISVMFYRNGYEINYPGSKQQLEIMYGGFLNEDEIVEIVEKIGNVLYNNIEHQLQGKLQ